MFTIEYQIPSGFAIAIASFHHRPWRCRSITFRRGLHHSFAHRSHVMTVALQRCLWLRGAMLKMFENGNCGSLKHLSTTLSILWHRVPLWTHWDGPGGVSFQHLQSTAQPTQCRVFAAHLSRSSAGLIGSMVTVRTFHAIPALYTRFSTFTLRNVTAILTLTFSRSELTMKKIQDITNAGHVHSNQRLHWLSLKLFLHFFGLPGRVSEWLSWCESLEDPASMDRALI